MTAQAKQKEKSWAKEKILAVDCCEHIISALESVLDAKLKSVSSRNNLQGTFQGNQIELIIIGASKIPVRRLFISRLRQFYPETPMLILRREKIDEISSKEWLRGEFLLSDRQQQFDLELVESIREVLPLEPCGHLDSHYNYDLVREVTRVLAENYTDPHLDLEQVAEELSISPSKLSRTLNRQVRTSFPQMLRQIRIEEAKRLLISQKFSVKEVSARVGFSDSHYFSRIFKEVTGLSPSEYEYSAQELIFS